MRNKFIILLFSLCYLPLAALATTSSLTAFNFDEIRSIYTKTALQPEKTLLVFDIDNTLLTISQPLGGIGWWEQQTRLLRDPQDSEKRWVNSFRELVTLENLFFQLIKMDKTDDYVLPFITEAVDKGSDILALTARSNHFLGVTLDQLEQNGFSNTQGQSLFKLHGLQLENMHNSIASLICDSLKDPVLAYEGIMFSNSQNKGVALDCALKTAKKKYTQVLFVDDQKYNVDAVSAAFEQDPDVHVTTILYTQDHAKEEAYSNNLQHEQETALEQWHNIKTVLQQNIKKSNF